MASQVHVYYFDEDDHEEKIEKIIGLLGKRVALPKMQKKLINFIKIMKTDEEKQAEEDIEMRPFIKAFQQAEKETEEREKEQQLIAELRKQIHPNFLG